MNVMALEVGKIYQVDDTPVKIYIRSKNTNSQGQSYIEFSFVTEEGFVHYPIHKVYSLEVLFTSFTEINLTPQFEWMGGKEIVGELS